MNADAPKVPAGETIKVRGGTVTRRVDGIIVAMPSEHDMGLEDAQEVMKAILDLAPKNKPVRMILDERGMSRKVLPEARKYFTSQMGSFDRIAVMVKSAVSRFFATWFITMASSALGEKVKIFDDARKADFWMTQDL